jgi:hypothetical protein
MVFLSVFRLIERQAVGGNCCIPAGFSKANSPL